MTKTLVGALEPEEPEDPDFALLTEYPERNGLSRLLSYDCRTAGHFVPSANIQVREGAFAGRCEYCDESFLIRRIPGGVSSKRVLALIQLLAEESPGDIHAIVIERDSIQSALDEDARALAENQRLMEVVQMLIEQRFF